MQKTYFIFSNGMIVDTIYEALALKPLLGEFKRVQHFDNREKDYADRD